MENSSWTRRAYTQQRGSGILIHVLVGYKCYNGYLIRDHSTLTCTYSDGWATSILPECLKGSHVYDTQVLLNIQQYFCS